MAEPQVPPSQTFVSQVPRNRDGQDQVHTRPHEWQKPNRLSIGSLAATGSTNADAAALSVEGAVVVQVTAADGTKGVILPRSAAGAEIRIHNIANAVLKVYPHVGGDINDGTTDASVNVSAKKPGVFVNLDGVTWSGNFS